MATGANEIIAHMRTREAERRTAGRCRTERLRALLPEAARLLRERHGAGRVVLFGSLATGTDDEASDVDLAVEGLPPERYFNALGELMALFRAPVDLLVIERACPSLRDRIASEGQEL